MLDGECFGSVGGEGKGVVVAALSKDNLGDRRGCVEGPVELGEAGMEEQR